MTSERDWLDQTWDVIVVGTGMGGATLGHALTERGHKLLFLERGHDLMIGGAALAELPRAAQPYLPIEAPARLAMGQWPTRLMGWSSHGTIDTFPALGCGTGGSTLLYAAQLERLFPADFKPRDHFPAAVGSTLPDAWPIAYEELLPHYRDAEALFHVCGSTDPLSDDPAATLRAPPPMSACDVHFLQSFRELGLQPYQAHVACDYVKGCVGCGGQVCTLDCKGDARRICLAPALRRGARLVTECEVLGLHADGAHVHSVQLRWQGEERAVRARLVVLAAGALFTPRLLLNSRSAQWPTGLANASGAVGRNLMFHASDFAAVRPRSRLDAVGPQKAVAMNDFYLHKGEKLGAFQSVGIPLTPGIIAQQFKERLPAAPPRLRRLLDVVCRLAGEAGGLALRSATLFATITEDLPYWQNRVIPDDTAPSGIRIEYHYPSELEQRTRRMRRLLTRALRPHHRVLWLRSRNNLNFGHACGTCRFGDDPSTSVLDRYNKAHGIDNLYVVDASFFPSSGGTNPSLTIAANALRVAPVISARLRLPVP